MDHQIHTHVGPQGGVRHMDHQIHTHVGPQGDHTQGPPDKPTYGVTKGVHSYRGHLINPQVGPQGGVTHRGHQINPHVGPKEGSHTGPPDKSTKGPQGGALTQGPQINPHVGPPMRDNIRAHKERVILYIRAGTSE